MSIQDDATAQAVKAWWKEYGKTVLAAIVIVAVVFYGIRFVQQQKLRVAVSASVIYDEYQQALANGDLLTIEASYGILLNDYKKTPYASAVSLIESARAANTGDLAGAEEYLQWVLDNGEEFAKPIARLRMAEVMVQAQDYDGAFALLEEIEEGSPYKAAYDELQGDILIVKGEISQALLQYQVALQEYRAQGLDNVLLQFKLQTYAPSQSVASIVEEQQ